MNIQKYAQCSNPKTLAIDIPHSHAYSMRNMSGGKCCFLHSPARFKEPTP